MYTVLARKYRSQSFDDVIGQNPIAQTLRNAIKTDKVAHAYLFTGTRGIGKTTMARILAKALNCLSCDGPTPQPCCKCDSCTAIHLGEDIDVIEIDGASNRGIDNIRELRNNAVLRPARCRFKIYIIDEVHMLTAEAFNALLKILEEPPGHVKFIFATTEPNKVLATIQSRCQRFDFNNISPRLIAEQLKKVLAEENIECEDDLVLPLAKMANGSMRDGLSLLDRLISTGVKPLTSRLLEEFLGSPNSEKIYNLVASIGESDAAGTLEATEDLIGTGLGEVQIVDALTDFMRDLMVINSAGAETELLALTAEQRQRSTELAKKFDTAALVYNITALEKLRWTIKNSEVPRALLDASLLRFALSEHFLNVDELLAQLQGGAVKKKRVISPEASVKVAAEQTKAEAASEPDLPLFDSVQSIKDNWRGILKLVGRQLGNGTAGLLGSASPVRFEDGLLTVSFPLSAQVQKKMCQSNGRTEQIESVVSEYCRVPVRLRFESTAAQCEAEAGAGRVKTGGRKKNEIVNDPAVKTVLMELDATITGIEEEQQN
jgi:DNA polymerase-3 subunit gamma/tau